MSSLAPSPAALLNRALCKVQAKPHLREALPHGQYFAAPKVEPIDQEIRGFIQ